MVENAEEAQLGQVVKTIGERRTCSASSWSGEDAFDEMTVDIRETIVAALKAISELFMVETQKVQESGVEIVNMDGIGRDIETEVIGDAVDVAFFQTAASEPDAEAAVVMITTIVAALDHGGAAELAAPDDESVVEETPLFEVFDESGAGLIGSLAVFFDGFGEVTVLVPGFMKELNETDTAFGEATCEQAVAGITGCLNVFDAIHVEDVLGLL
jgi:hypothetical protein